MVIRAFASAMVNRPEGPECEFFIIFSFDVRRIFPVTERGELSSDRCSLLRRIALAFLDVIEN